MVTEELRFLDEAPKFLFFTGKGGVGKTSISCASAIHLAQANRKVLLVSTDPASNIGQVFNQPVGNSPTTINTVSGLSAIDIDPQQAAHQYRERIVGPVRGVLPEDALRTIEEELSGACTTEIAAFDEFTALLTDSAIVEAFDHIIFDTAPTGHTIRLLQLPGAWSSFISDNPEGASCLGPLAGLEKQRERYTSALDALSDASLTRLALVSRPQTSALDEVARTHDELASLGIGNQYLVINGLLPRHAIADDDLAQAVWQRQQEAIKSLPGKLSKLPGDQLMLKAGNMVGVDALKTLFIPQIESAKTSQNIAAKAKDLPSFDLLVQELAENKNGLIMLMGKGGVGKTTMASALAVALAERGLDVHLTTSDPAAHIDNTLQGEFGNLTVSRIDPGAETEAYRKNILETKGKSLDARGRAVLEEDLRSPCTEEIAVFQAFSRIIREADKRVVIMDTAPTGHTLMLLDATGAYHKEVERLHKGKRFSTPMMRLQDPMHTRILIVTLPETTPVLEASNLQEDLRRAGIEPWAWIINNSLLAATTSSPLLIQRANHEKIEVDKVCNGLAKRVAVAAWQTQEPKGWEKLKTLVA